MSKSYSSKSYSLNTVEDSLLQTENLTNKAQQVSKRNLRAQIYKVTNSLQPYFANDQTVRQQITDIDHQPYTRFYRGDVGSQHPTLYDRAAGFRPTQNECYYSEGIVTASGKNSDGKAGDYNRVPKDTVVGQSAYPTGCFQPACTTIFPCKNGDSNTIHTTVLKI